jgi:hypothetical protein
MAVSQADQLQQQPEMRVSNSVPTSPTIEVIDFMRNLFLELNNEKNFALVFKF